MVGFCKVELKPVPVQAYVAPSGFTPKVIFPPKQMGADIVATIPVRAGLIITFVEPVPLQPSEFVTATVQVPLSAEVAVLVNGLAKLEVVPLGLVHKYVAPTPPLADKSNLVPVQTGLLLVAVILNTFPTLTMATAVAVHPFVSVTKTV